MLNTESEEARENRWAREDYEREMMEGQNSAAYDYDEDGNPTDEYDEFGHYKGD